MSIKIHSNSLASLRRYFSEKLSEIYDQREIDSFFFLGLAYYLGKSRLAYMQDTEQSVSESVILRFRSLAKELLKERPIQYILGETTFMDLTLKVSDAVLIPRPETEEIMADVFSKVKAADVIFDICSGSGCMGLSAKLNYPKAQVVGFEKSQAALDIASHNAKNNDLNVRFYKSDILHDFETDHKADLILSNPPYVLDSEKKLMQNNVLEYEPHMALFVPDHDPLLFYRSLVDIAVEKLNPEGWLFMEINEKFGKEIADLCKKAGLVNELSINQDLNGKDRWVSVKK